MSHKSKLTPITKVLGDFSNGWNLRSPYASWTSPDASVIPRRQKKTVRIKSREVNSERSTSHSTLRTQSISLRKNTLKRSKLTKSTKKSWRRRRRSTVKNKTEQRTSLQSYLCLTGTSRCNNSIRTIHLSQSLQWSSKTSTTTGFSLRSKPKRSSMRT